MKDLPLIMLFSPTYMKGPSPSRKYESHQYNKNFQRQYNSENKRSTGERGKSGFSLDHLIPKLSFAAVLYHLR